MSKKNHLATLHTPYTKSKKPRAVKNATYFMFRKIFVLTHTARKGAAAAVVILPLARPRRTSE